jgi:hypothetical protein
MIASIREWFRGEAERLPSLPYHRGGIMAWSLIRVLEGSMERAWRFHGDNARKVRE